MENSQNVELEAAKFLHKLIQESKDEPTKLATKLYVILQHMRSSGKENSMPYQVISRAMETVIKQHNLDIEALMSSRHPMASGTQIGDSTSLQLAGGAPGSYPAPESTDPITFGSSSHDNRSFAANINKDRSMEVFQATPSADLAAGKSGAGKPLDHGGTSTLVNAKKIVQIVSKMLSRTAQIRLVSSHPEVYDPCDDSFALVDALLADRPNLLEHRPSICMEIGCGSGYVITSLALMLGKDTPCCHFIATDINPHAVEVTRKTMEAHECYVELVATDIASGLEARLAGLVDVMVVNPPYVPTPEDEVGQSGIMSSWAGGENGRSVIDKILPVADKLLSDKGWLYLLTLAANNPSEICLQMRKKGYASRIVLQRSTEEESLHVIKFWRDLDIQMEESETTGLNRTEHGMLWNSLLSRVSRLPFWSDENHSSQ